MVSCFIITAGDLLTQEETRYLHIYSVEMIDDSEILFNSDVVNDLGIV
jgi:hypothetical protein